MARESARRVSALSSAAPRLADRARCHHMDSASPGRDPRVPVRLPRRHVRLLCHDGQRQGALDVPHARSQSRQGQSDHHRTSRQPACHPRPGDRHAGVLRQVGPCQGAVTADGDPPDDFARIAPASPARREVDAAIECIGCGICYASCDVVAWNPAYLGPAALNRAWTLVNDARDGGGSARLAAVAGDAGCHACHTQSTCTERCPKVLSPTASIAGLKRTTALAALKGDL